MDALEKQGKNQENCLNVLKNVCFHGFIDVVN